MSTLEQFDIAEANLAKLDALWAKERGHVPGNSPDADYNSADAQRSFAAVAAALPAIDAWKPDLDLPRLLTQMSFDTRSIDGSLREYKRRLARARRRAIREHVLACMGEIDTLLQGIRAQIGPNPDPYLKPLPSWDEVRVKVKELKILLGSNTPDIPQWHNFLRHVGFGEVTDLNDIERSEWPVIKSVATRTLYGEDDPVPGNAADLGALASARTQGPVTEALTWERIDDEGLERLLFVLLSTTAGYENVSWLMKTRAADGGRDLQAYRIIEDELADTERQRVIVQCRHWRDRSIAMPDVMLVAGQMELWGNPPVDVLVFATTGHFTKDAVQWIEKHNSEQKVPRIQMWGRSHLERLLSRRVELVQQFGLR